MEIPLKNFLTDTYFLMQSAQSCIHGIFGQPALIDAIHKLSINELIYCSCCEIIIGGACSARADLTMYIIIVREAWHLNIYLSICILLWLYRATLKFDIDRTQSQHSG